MSEMIPTAPPSENPKKKPEDMTIEELDLVINAISAQIEVLLRANKVAEHPLGEKALQTSISMKLNERAPYDMQKQKLLLGSKKES